MAVRSNDPVGPLLAGLAGALAVTVVHETARRVVPRAPRMDTLGRRALARGMEAVGVEPPPRDQLQALALAGDLVSNGLMYAAAVGSGPPGTAYLRGGLVGAAAGLGALALPPVLGIGPSPGELAPETRVMTVAWYTLGGLVAAGVHRRLRSSSS